MLVMCKRIGDLFSFISLGLSGSILQFWQNIIKVCSKSWLLTCSSNITLNLPSYNSSALKRKLNFCNGCLSLQYFWLHTSRDRVHCSRVYCNTKLETIQTILRQPCNSSRFFTDPLCGYLRLKWRGKEKSQSAPRSFIFSRKVCQTLFKLYLLPDTAASPVVHRVVGTSYNLNTARTEESGIVKECMYNMAIRVVEFSNGGYKIRKIFA